MDKAVKEALEPFAKAVGLYDERWPDERRLLPSNPDGSTVTLGDLRRARAALAHLNDSPAETPPEPDDLSAAVERVKHAAKMLRRSITDLQDRRMALENLDALESELAHLTPPEPIARPASPAAEGVRDPIEQHLIDRNRADTIARATGNRERLSPTVVSTAFATPDPAAEGVMALIEELRADSHRQPVDPKANYRTRRVGLFEEAADTLATLSAPGPSVTEEQEGLGGLEPTDEMIEAGWAAQRDSTKPAPFNQFADGLRAALLQGRKG
jgi:hypothetical protein